MSIFTLSSGSSSRVSLFRRPPAGIPRPQTGLLHPLGLPPLQRSQSDDRVQQSTRPSTGYTNYNPFVNASAPILPRYTEEEPEMEFKLPPPRFKIFPREEEGREELPAYSCSLQLEGAFERKMELRTPFARAQNRGWGLCYFVLCGTKLDVHRAKSGDWFEKGSFKLKREAGYIPGRLIESYTLQLAEVGAAADYKKRSFVIRLRLQDQQFLISFSNQFSYIAWLDALSAAIDLAPSLEERALPAHRTLPRRRRRNRQQSTTSSTTTTTNEAGVDAPETVAELHAANPNTETITAADLISSMDIAAVDAATRRALRNLPEESFDDSGKWAPRVRYTNDDNLRYAKRCVPLLYGDSPRKNDYVIIRGRRWRISWAQQTIIPDDGQPAKGPATYIVDGQSGLVAKELEMLKTGRLPEYEEVTGCVRRSAAF